MGLYSGWESRLGVSSLESIVWFDGVPAEFCVVFLSTFLVAGGVSCVIHSSVIATSCIQRPTGFELGDRSSLCMCIYAYSHVLRCRVFFLPIRRKNFGST